jgi:hypothetical protein
MESPVCPAISECGLFHDSKITEQSVAQRRGKPRA